MEVRIKRKEDISKNLWVYMVKEGIKNTVLCHIPPVDTKVFSWIKYKWSKFCFDSILKTE